MQWHRWLSPVEMSALLRAADLVVTHAGVASIVDAVRAGHRPIVVPRRQHLGEHVDDHQLQIVTALEDIGIVTRLHNAAYATPGPVEAPVAAWPPPGLKAAVRETVLGAGPQRPRSPSSSRSGTPTRAGCRQRSRASATRRSRSPSS